MYIYEVEDLPSEMLVNKTLFLYGCGKLGKELGGFKHEVFESS
jgi:hypothetical protein